MTLGLSAGAIQRRLGDGRLHAIHRGVYAVGHIALAPDGRAMAAVLACGETAVLSHVSAAELWGIRGGSSAQWDVTAAGMSGGRRGPAVVCLHRTRRLHREDVTALRGIPLTTPARTLVDLAGAVTARELAKAVHEAEVQRLLDVRAVEAVIARLPGRRGLRALEALLGPAAPEPERAAFVAAFLDLCRRHRLPRPITETYVDVAGTLHEIDVLFADQRLIVELDSERVHRTRRKFHTDRRRDVQLAARGYQTVRCTWQRVSADTAAVAAELHAVLALGPTADRRRR